MPVRSTVPTLLEIVHVTFTASLGIRLPVNVTDAGKDPVVYVLGVAMKVPVGPTKLVPFVKLYVSTCLSCCPLIMSYLIFVICKVLEFCKSAPVQLFPSTSLMLKVKPFSAPTEVTLIV